MYYLHLTVASVIGTALLLGVVKLKRVDPLDLDRSIGSSGEGENF